MGGGGHHEPCMLIMDARRTEVAFDHELPRDLSRGGCPSALAVIALRGIRV